MTSVALEATSELAVTPIPMHVIAVGFHRQAETAGSLAGWVKWCIYQ